MAGSGTDIPRSGDSPRDGNRYSSPVQRLFPAFPSGWPGIGLLLLRAAAGVALSLLPRSIPNVLGGLPATVFAALMAAAVVLLGPGAYSLDARLFGRREV